MLVDGHSDERTIHTFFYSHGQCQAGRGPTDSIGSPKPFVGEVAAGVVGTKLYVVQADQESSAAVGAWSVQTGEPIEELTRVAPLRWQNQNPARHTIRTIVQYAILAAALGAVFIWRRDGVIQAMGLASDHAFARLSYRFVAFFIDTAILMPVWAPVMYMLLFPEDGSPSAFEQMQLGRGELSAKVFWSRAIVGGLFAIYGTIFEHILGDDADGPELGYLEREGEPGHATTDNQKIFVNIHRRIISTYTFNFNGILTNYNESA